MRHKRSFPKLIASLALFVVLLGKLAPRMAVAQPDVVPPAQTALWKLKVERFGMPAVIVDDEIYVLGGGSAQGMLNDIERVDPKTGQVQSTPTKLARRVWHTAQADGPFVYILGGVKVNDSLDHLAPEVERYDTRTGKIAVMAPLPTPRRMVTSVSHDGKIYIIGGTDKTGKRTGVMEIYDINEDEWQPAPPMPTARECTAVEKDGVIYTVGGFDGKAALPTVEAYDIAKGTWKKLDDMPWVLSAHHMAVLGDELFSFGDYDRLDFVCAYNFVTQQWREVFATRLQPGRHTAVVGHEGTLFIIGGRTKTELLGSVQNLNVADLAAR
jgi:N-acetylneuraminic acid mutarotase